MTTVLSAHKGLNCEISKNESVKVSFKIESVLEPPSP